jgi:hypothetical protein
MQLLQGPNGQVKLRVSSLLNCSKNSGVSVMSKDADRLNITKRVQDKKMSGVNLKTGKTGFVNFQKEFVTVIAMEHRLVKAQFLRVLKK